VAAHTHTQREAWKEGRNSVLLIEICVLIYTLHVKKRKKKLIAPCFSCTQSVHSVCLQRGKATFVSCASVLATVQKSSFVELSSRSVHSSVRNPRHQLLLFLTSPVDYTHSTTQSLKIVTHEVTQHLISLLMRHFRDRHAAVIALIRRNLSLSALRTPPCVLRRKGNRQSLCSHPCLTAHRGMKQPSPPLCTLCLKRRLQRDISVGSGEGGGKKGIFTYRAVAGSECHLLDQGQGVTSINKGVKRTPACLRRRAVQLVGAFYRLQRAALPISALQSVLCGKRLLPSPAQ